MYKGKWDSAWDSVSAEREFAMLILTRREGEKLFLDTADGRIAVSLEVVDGRQTRIGIEAPISVQILRGEIA